MSRKIHIENLRIRLKNVSPAAARNIGSNLGGEILRRVAENTRQNAGTKRIEKLDAGRVENNRGASASEMQKRIARKIADLIGDRIR
jgi:hypothetical protein